MVPTLQGTAVVVRSCPVCPGAGPPHTTYMRGPSRCGIQPPRVPRLIEQPGLNPRPGRQSRGHHRARRLCDHEHQAQVSSELHHLGVTPEARRPAPSETPMPLRAPLGVGPPVRGMPFCGDAARGPPPVRDRIGALRARAVDKGHLTQLRERTVEAPEDRCLISPRSRARHEKSCSHPSYMRGAAGPP